MNDVGYLGHMVSSMKATSSGVWCLQELFELI